MNYSSLDDQVLMRMIAQTRAEALNELYIRYSRLVYSLAMHTLGDAAIAEEVTQDVFFRVWEKAGTYRAEQAKVGTWLTSITRNRAIDMLRRREVRPEGHSLGWDELADNNEPPSDSHNSEELAAQAIQALRVRAAITRLPADQQRALSLAFFGGYSHSEIAEKLGEPLGTVKTRIRMALHKLRNYLEEEIVLR
ncbi:MAG TPA: sigma-70 family RNA polymerase sigma factor [Anaerolineales bacterium]|nr:sigma-70 family RNA polymerase sigma factor [Anaerolineales bacterium]